MNIPAQSISLCCLGYHISCYGYYFRHYEYNVVEITPHIDFGEFHVRQYDQMCSVVRRYHRTRKMNRRRVSAEKGETTKTKIRNEYGRRDTFSAKTCQSEQRRDGRHRQNLYQRYLSGVEKGLYFSKTERPDANAPPLRCWTRASRKSYMPISMN